MKIISLQLNNYGSFYGDHVFRFDARGLVIVTGDNCDDAAMDSNASGKSTLFEALDWGLFGEVPKKDLADSVVNEEAGRDCVVRVLLEDDGVTGEITRSRRAGKGKKHSLSFNTSHGVGVDHTALDMKETQAAIERFLGLDRDTFRAAVMFGQFDRFNFAEATDSRRVELLTSILQLEDIDALLIAAKNERRSLEQQSDDLTQDLRGLTPKIMMAEKNLAMYKEQLSRWDDEHRAKLEHLQENIVEQLDYVESLQPQIITIPELRDRLDQLSMPSLSTEKAEVWEQLTRQQELRARARAEVTRCSEAKKSFLEEIEQFQSMHECPTCYQSVDAGHIEDVVKSCKAKITEAEETSVVWQQNELFAQEEIARLNQKSTELQQQEDEARQQFDDESNWLRTALQHAEQAEQYAKHAQAHADALEGQYLSAEGETCPFLEYINTTRDEMALDQKSIDEKQAQLSDVKQRASLIDFWIEAFGPKGLKSYIFDAKMDELGEAVNKWVTLLTGGMVWVQFSTQALRQNKSVANEINIRVYRYNTDGSISERGYNSLSGGERQRVSLGIDFGLAGMIARRAKKHYTLLILDELYRHLDATGKRGVVGMLHALRETKDSIFVIEHDAEFTEAFEHRVTIQKQGGRSCILEGVDALQKSEERASEKKPKRAKKRRRVAAGPVVSR